MLEPNKIKELLSDRNLSEVARRSGVGYQALNIFMKRKIHGVEKYEFIKKLSDYLEQNK